MASERIERMIDELIKREGGYVNNPADKGGPTKYGITQGTLSKYLGRQATIEDVKNLNIDLAKEIYLVNYYKAPRIDTLPDDIEDQVFDIAVNSGAKRAIQFCQRICNSAGFGPIDEDGVLGPQSRKAIATAYQEMREYFTNALVEERKAFFENIVQNNPSQQIFLKGWLVRAESFRVAV